MLYQMAVIKNGLPFELRLDYVPYVSEKTEQALARSKAEEDMGDLMTLPEGGKFSDMVFKS
jgi:hypothetical protein